MFVSFSVSHLIYTSNRGIADQDWDSYGRVVSKPTPSLARLIDTILHEVPALDLKWSPRMAQLGAQSTQAMSHAERR